MHKRSLDIYKRIGRRSLQNPEKKVDFLMANKNGGLNNTRPTFTNVNNVYQQEKTVTKAYHQSTTNIGEDFFKTEKNYFC